MSRNKLIVLALIGAAVGNSWAAAPSTARRRPARPRPSPLVWHVETLDGTVLESSSGDEPINPASVVKVATALWALERLGPSQRFETRVGRHGTLDPAKGVLAGDLLVLGGADPDFHVQNAFLVADALNRAGVREVQGKLLVDDAFWIGWEGGSEHREPDPAKRAQGMASRLRAVLDPALWTRPTRGAWWRFAAEHAMIPGKPPRVSIRGGVGVRGTTAPDSVLLVHRSNELGQILKRFAAFSNNDIERLEPSLGPPSFLASHVQQVSGISAPAIELQTLSGLGTNRMTPRQVVGLLRELRRSCERHGLRVGDVLPTAGCDPGTLRAFARLDTGPVARCVVGKTGTLTSTDGGISVLAGFASTVKGELLFCVAVPRSGIRPGRARWTEDRWVEELILRNGGPRALACAAPVGRSDDRAEVLAAP